ncbi:MAG: NAD(P)/FAD-dependent oxidoreductase, partial [Desulfobacterales bacterium]|nr:NAD(P)/FAD-dependent oxidoreductase [Desulfobacterales bacterium]
CRSPDFERAYALMKTMEAPEMALFTCYDVSDPDFSPPGTCQAALVTLQYADHWLSIPPTRYADAKYAYARSMLDLAETVFPGCRKHIEEVEAATPLTHMRYLGHPGGAIYGFDSYAKDSRLFASPRCPIKGLYFSGAWASGGGFQPTLDSGAAAARAIVRHKKGN